ncbi:MAG: ComEC/Rec2 family competence protein [Pseudomonadota bacterium]
MSRRSDQKPEKFVEEGLSWSVQPADERQTIEEWQGWSEPEATSLAALPVRSRLRERLSIIADAIGRQLQIEADRGAAFLWAPVCLAAGIVMYFHLPREPWAWAFEALAVGLAVLAFASRNRPLLHVAMLAFSLIAGGAGLARLHSTANDTQMLDRVRIVTVSGEVRRREMRADGSVRYRLAVTSGELARADGLPRIFRITARAGGPSAPVGSRMKGLARLSAPSGPAYPGGYDFSFPAWFDGLSGSGFFLGAPEAMPPTQAASGIEAARDRLASLIRESVPGEGGGIAAALIVGDRSGITEETTEALRQSGLAHILAISGLHMALVALTAMGGLRLLFASFPHIALRYPVKKWAAAGGLAAATIYLALSGMAVSTQRAWIMMVIMLGAVILDRRALTMRNVALAALVVMVISPEAILSAGFQMSFAAVAALVAVYEGISRQTAMAVRGRKGGFASATGRILKRDVGGLALTSLVAGLATSIFAAYHFQRLAPLGLLANLAAMPVVSVAVMPLALLSMLSLPFGLHDWPLAAMAWSTEWVVTVAHFVSAMGPTGETGRIPASAFLCATVGLLVMTLARSRLELCGLLFFLPALLFMQTVKTPDILISEDGRQIALFNKDGSPVLLRERGNRFVTDIWTTAYRAKETTEGQPAGDGFTCDADGCSTIVKGLRIVHLKTSANLLEDCEIADILVAEFRLSDACQHLSPQERPRIFDGSDLQAKGRSLFISHRKGPRAIL